MSNQLTLIKVGSSSCIDSDARTIRFGFMEQLAKSIAAEIERDGSQRFAIISSGAVAKGRIVAEHSNRLEKNHYAWLGQWRIFTAYRQAFELTGLGTAELLLHDIASEVRLACDDSIDDMTISQIETYHQQAVARHVTSYADARLISIINHNDAGALWSSRFSDNDLLTRYIAQSVIQHASLRVRRVVFLSWTRGILDDNGRTVEWSRLNTEASQCDAEFERIMRYVRGDMSTLGTGGAASKLREAWKIAKLGTDVLIAWFSDRLEDILSGTAECTRFEFAESEG